MSMLLYDELTPWYRLLDPVADHADEAAAYASALAAGNPNPGGDESVVSDQMILSAVQAHWNPDWETPPDAP